MIWNFGSILLFLSICGIVVSNPERAVDCRKFVFAPLCRGIAAKRDFVHKGYNVATSYDNGKSLQEMLKNIYQQVGVPVIEEDENGNSIRKGQSKRLSHYNRMSFGRVNSENENEPIQEFENL